MAGPLLYAGLYDRRRDNRTLLADTASAITALGARVEAVREDFLLVHDHPRFAPDGDSATVEILPAEDGALVQLAVPLGDLAVATDAEWRPLTSDLAALIVAVRPELATAAVEEPPDGLADPDWDEAPALFGTGWVDLTDISDERRAAFETLRQQGFATNLGSGIWWSAPAALSVEDEPEALPHMPLVAAVYEAWTGQTAPEPEPTAVPAPPVNQAQLWFWSANLDPAELKDRVAAALPQLSVRVVPGEAGWEPVVAEGPTELPTLLADLRTSVASVHASWAGLQPTGGVAVPGLDPEIPATGFVVHPWVDRRWIGDDLAALDEALAGSHREEVADGILYVTDPDLADGLTEDWADPADRWQRLVRAAEVLARAARRVTHPGPTGWIGER